MRIVASLALLCIVSGTTSVTFRSKADHAKECIISFDGENKLTTECPFESATTSKLHTEVTGKLS
jgi:hypothetical protein